VTLKDVGIARLDPGRFEAVLDPEDCRRLLGRLAQAARHIPEESGAHLVLAGPVGFGRAVQALLTDRDRAQRMGEAAHRRVCSDYLAPRRLIQDLDLIDRVAG
jgi:hypothetical protein